MTKRLVPRFSRKESKEFFQTLNKRVNHEVSWWIEKVGATKMLFEFL
jgi:hypothetical protein